MLHVGYVLNAIKLGLSGVCVFVFCVCPMITHQLFHPIRLNIVYELMDFSFHVVGKYIPFHEEASSLPLWFCTIMLASSTSDATKKRIAES